MGLKDRGEDGADLDYLHVEGAGRQAWSRGGLQVRAGPAGNGSSSGADSSADSGYSGGSSFSEDSVMSDLDLDLDLVLTLDPAPAPAPHPDPDPAADPDPDPDPDPDLDPDPAADPDPDLDPAADPDPDQDPAADPDPDLDPAADPDPDQDPDCRSKVEFALKLGYSDELVLLVLRKLGPHALINDILGELVKLGTKTHMEQQQQQQQQQGPPPPPPLDSCRLQDLRPVVVDGSNVAMSHGNKEVFSCQGIQLAVDWFLGRGHRDVTVFVPAWRKEQCRPDALIADQEILRRLEREKILVFTPSRHVQGRRVVCYDDRFIVKLAYESDGIIVSNDNYRDLASERAEWRRFIDQRLLMYSFVNDKFMPPDDPLGRHGPSLETFLRKRPVSPGHRKQACPYGTVLLLFNQTDRQPESLDCGEEGGFVLPAHRLRHTSCLGKKCTYGHKCKFHHPERGVQPQRAVADELRAGASRGLLEQALHPKSPSPTGAETRTHQDSSPQSSGGRLTEGGRHTLLKAGGHRGAGTSIVGGHPAPGASPPPGLVDPGGSRRAAASGLSQADSVLGRGSADVSLGLVPPQTPQRRAPDLQGVSSSSDCGSEGSAGSHSALLEDGPVCRHHHLRHLRHLHHLHPAPFSHRVRSTPPDRSSSSGPPGLQQAFSVDEPPPSVVSRVSPPSFRTPPGFIPPQHQPPMLSSSPGSPRQSQTAPLYPQPHISPIARNLLGVLWQEGGLLDSRVYEGSPLHSRRSCSALTPQINWESNYQPANKPCYDPPPESLPQVRPKAWLLPCLCTQRSHQASAGPHQEPPTSGRYQDLRHRTFLNLCGIFPPDLVRAVMSRNPLTMDAQELAAAILLETPQQES